MLLHLTLLAGLLSIRLAPVDLASHGPHPAMQFRHRMVGVVSGANSNRDVINKGGRLTQ